MVSRVLLTLAAALTTACVTATSNDSTLALEAEANRVDPVDLPATAYHAVEGWPGWVCADAPGGERSQWYGVEQGIESVSTWEGDCASWQRSAVGLAAAGDVQEQDGELQEPGETDAFRVVLGWPAWRCADYKDGRDKSVWYTVDQGADTATTRKGKCDSWAR